MSKHKKHPRMFTRVERAKAAGTTRAAAGGMPTMRALFFPGERGWSDPAGDGRAPSDGHPPTYTEVPAALSLHAGALGLTFADIGFIIALHSFTCYADSASGPSIDTLAEQAGVSTETIGRQVRRLAQLGLLTVTRRGGGKCAPVDEYDLTRLWEALAAIVREARPALSVVGEAPRDDGGGRTAA